MSKAYPEYFYTTLAVKYANLLVEDLVTDLKIQILQLPVGFSCNEKMEDCYFQLWSEQLMIDLIWRSGSETTVQAFLRFILKKRFGSEGFLCMKDYYFNVSRSGVIGWSVLPDRKPWAFNEKDKVFTNQELVSSWLKTVRLECEKKASFNNIK